MTMGTKDALDRFACSLMFTLMAFAVVGGAFILGFGMPHLFTRVLGIGLIAIPVMIVVTAFFAIPFYRKNHQFVERSRYGKKP